MDTFALNPNQLWWQLPPVIPERNDLLLNPIHLSSPHTAVSAHLGQSILRTFVTSQARAAVDAVYQELTREGRDYEKLRI